MAEDVRAGRRTGIDRRGRIYLAGTVAGSVGAGFVAPVLAYVVLAGFAAGAWVTHQSGVVRWTLTLVAGVLIASLVLGFSVSTVGHGSSGGPITGHP